MSRFTDHIHDLALSETIHWRSTPPESDTERYQYGMYLFRLKEFVPAFEYFKSIGECGSIPGKFQYALCLQKGYGTEIDECLAAECFHEVLLSDRRREDALSRYRVAYCLMYGLGVSGDEEESLHLFKGIQESVPEALYELGLSYRFGRGGIRIDFSRSREYLRRSYDRFCEDAIFQIFEMHEGPFINFPYIREIKEAFSFRLGQYMRAAEINPSRDSLLRVAQMYESGYPGDVGDKDLNFRRKADKYLKKVKELSLIRDESEVYKN